MKRVLLLVLVFSMILSMSACGKKNSVDESEINKIGSVSGASISGIEFEDTHEGEVQSKLTGLWVPKKYDQMRPYAVMINNIYYAGINQYGVSEASIIYEALAEGGITRLMAIFEDFASVKKIGSVRSARHYYVSFADTYNAIFCHFGHTKYALAKIDELKIDNISGLSSYGSAAYHRVSDLKPPHNAFTSYKELMTATKMLKYKTKYTEKPTPHYSFYDEDTDIADGSPAMKITLPYSSASTSYFTYDTKTKMYDRYQYGGKHIDNTNKKQLSFKNLIVMYVSESNIDHNGYQTMDIVKASGKGYYLTNGKVMDIKWKKDESKSSLVFTTTSGQVLTVNTGKTYIGVFPKNNNLKVSIKKKK